MSKHEDQTEPGSGRVSDDDLIAAALAAAGARSGERPAEPALPPPDYFPGYVVSREIHRGGQGIVYQAVHKTTKRKVAIKVMIEGVLASVRERTRFEREVEILAQLDHPGIVDVLDSGSVEGRFYYVMDYVSGSTLDVWIAQREPSIPEVLELFSRVCDAVNAAHLKGVIHRDLKPANVRVDADGRPHIVDFGLARVATGGFSDDDKAMTMTGQFIGSLPWASPEQAQGIPGMIDVRTDVYSLGVMLYQMLTGRFPYRVAGAMRDVLDAILRAEPARPSTVRRQINDEVETIVLKCLSKERERRYQNAGELGRDIAHYLRGEPIEAKRDSGWYVLRKAVRRHRPAAAFGVTFLVLLVAFGAGMSVLNADKARALERLGEEAAARREVIAELERWLEAPNPTLGAGADVTVRQVASEAGARLDGGALEGQPRAEASLRSIIGKTLFGLGEWRDAEAHLRRALMLHEQTRGPDDPETIETAHQLGVVLRNLVALEEAGEVLAQAAERAERVLGPAHPSTAHALHDLGQVHKLAGRHGAAASAIERAIAAAEGAPGFDAGTLAVMRANLGEALAQSGQAGRAETLLAKSLDELLALRGPAHPDVGRARVRLAALYQATERPAEACEQLELACGVFAGALDPHHPDALATRLRLAALVEREGDPERAAAMFLEIVEAGEATLPPESPVLAWYRHLAGRALLGLGRTDQALALLEPAVAALEAAEHPRAPDAAATLQRAREAVGSSSSVRD